MSFRGKYFQAMKDLKHAYEVIEKLEEQLGIAHAAPPASIGADFVVLKTNFTFIEAMRFAKNMSRARRPAIFHTFYGRYEKDEHGNFLAGVGYSYLKLQTLLDSEGWSVLESKEAHD